MKFDNQKISKIKKSTKNVAYFGLGFIVNTLYINLVPYAISTDVRLSEESKNKKNELNEAFEAGVTIAPVFAIFGLMYQTGMYFLNPKYLAIPIATNIASIIYEDYRSRKGKH